MRFFVLGDQGQKYGPADVLTLNQWIAEGRLMPHTMLEDEVSGGQIAASGVSGLQFQVAQPPMVSNYPRNGVTPGAQPATFVSTNAGVSDFRLALAMAVISPICSFFLPIGGLIAAGAGIRASLRAKALGHSLWMLVLGLNIVGLIIWIVTRAARHF